MNAHLGGEPVAAGRTHLFVVAIEYAGAELPAHTGGRRRPLLEHAWDVHTGTMLAHPDQPPRVAFPEPERAWPSAPQLARCVRCTSTILDVIAAIIGDVLAEVLHDVIDVVGH